MALVPGPSERGIDALTRAAAHRDREADTRASAFSGHAFPSEEAVRRRIGPVVMHDELEVVQEVSLLDGLRFTLRLDVLAAGSVRVEDPPGEAVA